MDHNLEDSLTLDGVMDFDHSEDVVNQEDIPLEDSGSLNITMDMDDVGDQPHTIMETVNDEVIVSDLIEDPFPFQEYTVQSDGASSSNIMVDQNQLNQLTVQHELATPSLQTLLKAPQAATNPVTQKVQTRPTKRMVASAPPRQVAIAPKPVPTKAVHYAIAPKPVALIANKHNVGSIKKIPITSDGKGNTVLAQLGRQLVMVPKKIKLMSSTSGEGVIKTSSSGLQYQVACCKDQAQLLSNTNKGPKPMLKFIQLQGQSGAEQSSTSGVLTKMLPASGPQARYVMQQKTVPISIGGNKVVQNFKIAGKKQIIAIKSQSPKVVQVSQGNVTTKQVVISSNSNQKVLIRTTAPTSTTQVIKDTGSMGQRTQYHPINVPGKGIQYIKLVTNQPAQKPAAKQMAVPSTNFVFTDSKGNVIQMTAEKVAGAQPPSIAHPTAVSGNKGVVKALKSQKKLVRIAPVSKAASQSITHPSRSTHSLLTPLTTAPSAAPMTSLPAISTPSASPAVAEPAVTLEFNEMVEHSDGTIQPAYNQTSNENANRVSYNLSNYDPNDFSIAEIDYSTTEQYSAEDTSQPLEETVGGSTDPDETIEEKPPTLQSLISEVVSEEISRKDGTNRTYDVGIEYGNKRDTIRNASFTLRAESSMGHDAGDTSALNNEDSIIIVPGTNYTERQNESFYSEESQAYRSQRLSLEDRKEVPLLSVEAECHPYPEHIQPESPLALDSEEVSGLDMRPRKACNCTKSQCLKLYCDCFANGEFCNNCNCNNCCNNLENEEIRQKSIRSCLERNPNAFRPKIGKSKTGGPELIRRHTKGCNCKRSGCLKNYCECYEAKIACTAMCKCVGCRNVEETLVRRRDAMRLREKLNDTSYRPAPAAAGPVKQPCSFMTTEVIEAVCQCLIAAAGESDAQRDDADPVQDVIEEFARCLQDVITASHHTL